MKWLVFSLLALVSFAPAQAKERPDSVRLARRDSIRTHRYDRRLHHVQKSWEKLIPTHLKMQYAGSIGAFSVGMGWDYGKRGQWETDVMLGFLPKYQSDEAKMTFTLKENYVPWSVRLNDYLDLEPLSCGLFFNSVLDGDFWRSEPDRYPKGYYNFNLRIRTHVFVGQRITLNIPHNKRLFCKRLTAYYELSTCDLYVVSAVQNKYIKLKDILSLGLGVKMQIF